MILQTVIQRPKRKRKPAKPVKLAPGEELKVVRSSISCSGIFLQCSLLWSCHSSFCRYW